MYIIINSSPYNKSSNTSQIAEALKTGIVEEGRVAEIYSLFEKKKWDEAMQVIIDNENTIFVLPVYLGNVPSILKEFLERLIFLLPDDTKKQKRLSFVVQSGFPEASQRRYCEKYLKVFVEQLGCTFSGILSSGIYYGLIDNKGSDNLEETYRHFAREYIINGNTFFFQEAADFNGVEYLTQHQAKKFVRGFNFMCRLGAEEHGCKTDLFDAPHKK